MAEHIGIIIETLENGLVRVAADRKGACGGCAQQGGGCRACLSGGNRVESEATNPLGAKVGDLVKLEMSTSGILSGTALVYFLPVLALAIGAVAGNQVLGMQAGAGELGAIIGALLGFFIGCAILMAVDRNQKLRERWRPNITRVVRTGVGAPARSGTAGKPHSCCG